MANRSNDYDCCNSLKITRRDFLNGVLIGAGSTLLPPHEPLFSQTTLSVAPDDAWYGFGGIGGILRWKVEFNLIYDDDNVYNTLVNSLWCNTSVQQGSELFVPYKNVENFIKNIAYNNTNHQFYRLSCQNQ